MELRPLPLSFGSPPGVAPWAFPWALLAAMLVSSPATAAGTAANAEVTWARDVAPLIQAKCQECHRPKGLAPFSLVEYEQVRAWSRSIRREVGRGTMPPWGLDPEVGEWANDPTFTPEERRRLFAWLEGGMPFGDEADLPPPREFHDEWSIGKPDMVFEMPREVTVPAEGVVAYQHFVTELGLDEDLWVQAAEVIPGNRQVVHHVIVFLQPPGGRSSGDGFTNTMLDVYAPGSPPGITPPGVARKIPAGSKLLWQVHYTPTGEEQRDRSKFGIVLADEPPRQILRTATVVDTDFEIPPYASDHRVEAEATIPRDATIYSFTPHMHYRGKSMDFLLVYPDGREELVCSIPDYDFDWQLDYRLKTPLEVPGGTRLRVVAHFDNSRDNPDNPDPSQSVRWGEQTWEEMMMGGIFLSWAEDGEAPAAGD
ncbi:MAG: cytochrome c [Acidobacteria bacterium]|nr:MAG: cytochrome c [Acidobacteriota bacterium]REJ99485.1 MAG: cytochrome c [Acidobacteriota bacterium]